MNNTSPVTAISQGIYSCHICRGIQRDTGAKHPTCHRCGESLHYRGKDSLIKTWALCISASIFLVFANVFPIMTVTSFGSGHPDTIISGVMTLVAHGMIPIALVVFIASIAVPLLKLAGLFWLLLMLQFNWKIDPRQCVQLYRMVVFIGRWSMLDLFVIAILVTLVDMQGIASVTGGPAATFFSTVVVLTMFAAHSFDPRLIWDLQQIRSSESDTKSEGIKDVSE